MMPQIWVGKDVAATAREEIFAGDELGQQRQRKDEGVVGANEGQQKIDRSGRGRSRRRPYVEHCAAGRLDEQGRPHDDAAVEAVGGLAGDERQPEGGRELSTADIGRLIGSPVAS